MFGKKKIDAYLEPYDYKGRPAISVDTFLGQVGNIAEKSVPTVTKLMARMSHCELVIDFFEDYEDKLVYTAKVMLYLTPDESAVAIPSSAAPLKKDCTVETLAITGHTTKNPDGEFVQEVLSRLKRSRNIQVSFGEHPNGKEGTMYVYANGMVVGSIYKKDQSRLKELASSAAKVELNIITTPSGPGYSDYHKSELKFYI